MNTVFYRAKNTQNYSVINNAIFEDVSLSWKAKGLFCYLLSLPNDWQIHAAELEHHASDGRDSLKAAIKELVAAGFLEVESRKDESGRFAGNCYKIIEQPQRENRSGKTVDGKTAAEKPLTEKPQLLNTNNTNYLNNKILNKQNTNKKKAAFVPPTVDEVKAYCEERNNKVDAVYFVDYYTARQWHFNNGGKMKDWRATVRTWERRNFESSSNTKAATFDADKKTF